MSQARFLVGDVFDVLASLEPGSVDLVMTSPPFLALRSYLPADHPQKAREIGSEATPGEFIDRMLDVVEACARVLAPHGSLVFELGDTYAGSGGAGGDYSDEGLRAEQPKFDGAARRTRASGARTLEESTLGVDARNRARRGGNAVLSRQGGWPLDKSKVLIPQLFAIALAYGFNPLTGRQTDPWRVRNTVAFCRPNPPVGRDGDKFRPATSFLTVACKARDRYWDGDAVRTNLKHPGQTATTGARSENGDHRALKPYDGTEATTAGAPLLDWWEIPTEPYKSAHFATYPRALVVPVVKSMCPQRVCRTCGKPSARITGEPTCEPSASYRGGILKRDGERVADGVNQWNGDGAQASVVRTAETLGWSDCDCSDDRNPSMGLLGKWRPGVVLDPFAGSGTTLAVATGHGLDAIGIDLDERNAELAYERIGGLFLTIEHPVSAPLGAHALGECSTSGTPNP